MLALAVARRVVEIHTRCGGRLAAWPVCRASGQDAGRDRTGCDRTEIRASRTGIGMRVIAWTMHPNPALGFELVELDDLLGRSDVVSLHLRLSPQTAGFLGRDQLLCRRRVRF